MKLFIILVLLLTLSVSCARKKKKASPEMSAQTTQSLDDNDDFIVDEEDQELDENTDEPEEKVTDNEPMSNDMSDEDEQMANNGSEIVLNQMGQYIAQKNETLMMIAFKIYGDYGKWKDLSLQNGGINIVRAGQTIKYRTPNEKFTWSPEGMPYLIQNNDTLGTISKDKYGTVRKWRSIYENNRPLIKDPNLIFAGFTIYYKDLSNIARN